MKKNKETSSIIDFIVDFLFYSGFILMFLLVVCIISEESKANEERCVIFYKENHYITESCKKYSNKLEALDSNENKK